MWRLIFVVILLLALPGCGGDQGEKYLQAGFAYFQQHDYDRAIENYEKAIASGAKSAGAYNMLGMAYRFKHQQTGNPELQQNEIDAFQKAVNIDSKYWVAMINLGTTYYSRGDQAKAIPWFKKALALNPNHPEKAQIDKMIAAGAKEAGKPARKSTPRSRPDGRDDSE
jgi:tetratricopeptide (TPR) repeat protein